MILFLHSMGGPPAVVLTEKTSYDKPFVRYERCGSSIVMSEPIEMHNPYRCEDIYSSRPLGGILLQIQKDKGEE